MHRIEGWARLIATSGYRMTKLNPELEILTHLELYFSIRHTARSVRAFAEVFDYDYDRAIIFLSIAEVCFQATFHLAPIGYGPAEIERIYSQVAGAGLSVATIGEITGIPRETVRRKVKSLIDEGYLATSSSNTIYLPLSAITSDRILDKMSAQFKEASQFSKMVNFYQR